MILSKSIILLHNKEDYLRCLLIYSFLNINIGSRLHKVPSYYPVYLRLDKDYNLRRGNSKDIYIEYIVEEKYTELNLTDVLKL